MELKPYQQQVINDLEDFLGRIQETKDVAGAFYDFWSRHPRTPLLPFSGQAIEPYKNNIPHAPHVCVKVPTAGGKTFIACNAIKTIFNAFDHNREKAVVWLVPSVVILEQTIRNLKDPEHAYRQKINAHFSNRVAVYNKQDLLQANSFNAALVREQLSIFVLSFDSLRAKNKDNRKVYEENSSLQSFGAMVGDDENISLMRVIQSLNPVLIVDESHNAESELSVEMLKDLNPCFILDLTATPRNNSNIISFVDAMELKKENMVKLPVIVSNHQDKTEVIHAALQLQRHLEEEAKREEKSGGRYIRPIVLFQAQPKNAVDTITFEKIKEKLIALKIPEEQIKIKASHINEIKDVDLTAPDCPVRYIITVNALKEGWDCPFAYILASLADRSSPIDVEQILGRILRQPYVTHHNTVMLNMCYVLTASEKFLDTLDNIVKGLNKAGFSSKDFKLAELPDRVLEERHERHVAIMESQPVPVPAHDPDDIDIKRILNGLEEREQTDALTEIVNRANDESTRMDLAVTQEGSGSSITSELMPLVKIYRLKEAFAELASQILIPQFYIHTTKTIFNASDQLLAKEDLLKDFQLSSCDARINFENVSAELYKIDLDETRRDYTPSFMRLDGQMKHAFVKYINDPAYAPYKLKTFTGLIMELMGNLQPISEQEIKKYIHSILADFTDEQYRDLLKFEYSYSKKIKDRINSLADAHAENTFNTYLRSGQIFSKKSYAFAPDIIPGDTSKSIAKSLYEKEGAMNGFEERVINEAANLPNIIFWTRNAERRQFKINGGFLNHYPDFILYTQRHTLILLETKGDDRDNSDSAAKLALGKAWEQKAGKGFNYFMVFDKQNVPNAHRLDDFLKLLKEL